MRPSFLTTAPTSANLALSVEMAMAFGLTFGAWMARHRWYRGHRWCQSGIVLLNAVLVATYMVPSFVSKVYPRIPEKLDRSFYSLATAHATLAGGVELAALYLVLTAGTDVVPKRLRLANFKTGMRIVLAGWWLVFFLGLATYARWYVRWS